MNLTTKTLKQLQEYYTGKMCSVFLNSKERSLLTEVRNIETDGIWGQHPENFTAVFIPMDQVAMIVEEVILDPSNPDDARLIQEYEQKNRVSQPEPAPAPKQDEVAFVDIRQLGNLARQTKMNYDNLEKIGR